MKQINKHTIFDSFWWRFCDGLDTLKKTELASITYERADEKHYISFPNGQNFTVQIVVEEVKE